MKGLVADANFFGHLERLVAIIESPDWEPFWRDLSLTITDFGTLGLAQDTDDRTVWQQCQAEQLVLLTCNRNDDGPDSLEAAIRDGPPTALPVFTIADGQRLMLDADYARAVAVQLLDYLIDLRARPEMLLGAGRLYLPKNPI